jgi:hypothetical protein
MSIHRFFTKEVVIKRLSSVGGYKKQFQSTATVDGHLQELSREAAQRLGIVEERAWIFWCDIEESIKEGDTMIDENGTEYKVKEITKKDYGVNEHLQVILEEPEPNE